MLDKSSLIAFAATQNPEQAEHFYGEVLGLQWMADEQSGDRCSMPTGQRCGFRKWSKCRPRRTPR